MVHFVEKAKGARSAELCFEGRRIERHTNVLLPYQRVGEIYFEAHRKAVIGRQRGRCTLLANAHCFENFYRAPRCVLLDEASALDQEKEGRRTAVHDRHFRTVQFYDDVINFGTGQRSHQVLHRTNRDPFAI
jgi:hypothetical protein